MPELPEVEVTRLIGFALAMTACAAPQTEDPATVAPAPTPIGTAVEAPLPPPDPPPPAPPTAAQVELPSDARVRRVLEALRGVCTPSWDERDGRVVGGCKSCPISGGTSPPPATLEPSRELPELVVDEVFEARLFDARSTDMVLATTGCTPGVFGYSAILLVQRSSGQILRNDPGLSLTACQAAPDGEREVLVCSARQDSVKMMAGTTTWFVGVYDPVRLRKTDTDDPTDIAAWHSVPLFTSDADYQCVSGGPPPGQPLRYGRVDSLSMTAPRATLTGTFVKRAAPAAFRDACNTAADLEPVLVPKPFALRLTLNGSRLTPDAATRAWLGKNR